MARYLVTGGCGFIGSNLVRYLLAETDHEIFNVDLWDRGKNTEDTIYNSKAVGEPPFMLGISAAELTKQTSRLIWVKHEQLEQLAR